jgi:hypothetical protein
MDVKETPYETDDESLKELRQQIKKHKTRFGVLVPWGGGGPGDHNKGEKNEQSLDS